MIYLNNTHQFDLFVTAVKSLLDNSLVRMKFKNDMTMSRSEFAECILENISTGKHLSHELNYFHPQTTEELQELKLFLSEPTYYCLNKILHLPHASIEYAAKEKYQYFLTALIRTFPCVEKEAFEPLYELLIEALRSCQGKMMNISVNMEKFAGEVEMYLQGWFNLSFLLNQWYGERQEWSRCAIFENKSIDEIK